MRGLHLFTSVVLLMMASGAEASPNCPSIGAQDQPRRLLVRVVDENGVAVVAARLVLTRAGAQSGMRAETDYAGQFEFSGLEPGAYQLRVEKDGFYASLEDDVKAGDVERIEITLNHQQEFAEVMDVAYSAPAIDPTKTSTSESLGSNDVINLPYPTTREVRNLLAFIPGVAQDPNGRLHVAGSMASQVFNQLDGFNVSHPVSGVLGLRVSVDALRSIELQSSRYSAEHGKGSGGVLSLITGMGDDRFRFSATNFVPAVQTRKGISIDSWTPRATVSGPLRKKRAWFFQAADAEYNLDIIEELPPGADRNSSWRLGSLSKAQVNLNDSNILSGTFLVNRFHSPHTGLSRFSPLETTLDRQDRAFLITMKLQSYLSNRVLVEAGLGVSQFETEERPMGTLPYEIGPGGARGNYFRSTESTCRRLQWVSNLMLPPAKAAGRHELRLGLTLDRITFRQLAQRRPILIYREDGTLARQIVISNERRFSRSNVEVGGYVQDRWAPSVRLLLELGVRFDWDQILRGASASPRLAVSYLLTRDGDTKLAGGIGVFRDATNLDLMTRGMAGRRLDLFYSADGKTPERPPVETIFLVDERRLEPSRLINWSVGVERKLPALIYMRAEFLQKRGRKGLTFINSFPSGVVPSLMTFELTNGRRDSYDSVQVTLRRAFRANHSIFVAYTRSSARSNAVFDFSVDSFLLAERTDGRLEWDAPNRLISWGWLGLPRRFDLAYSIDWRDGFPYSLVNQEQRLLGQPNSRRLPAYFSLNLHAERRLKALGFQWALRAGFNNVTNRANPTGIDNNVDSPRFGTLGGLQHRTFTGRIRFLGRK